MLVLTSSLLDVFFLTYIKFYVKLTRRFFHALFSGLWVKLFVSGDVVVGWVTATPFCRETADILVPSDWSNFLF